MIPIHHERHPRENTLSGCPPSRSRGLPKWADCDTPRLSHQWFSHGKRILQTIEPKRMTRGQLTAKFKAWTVMKPESSITKHLAPIFRYMISSTGTTSPLAGQTGSSTKRPPVQKRDSRRSGFRFTDKRRAGPTADLRQPDIRTIRCQRCYSYFYHIKSMIHPNEY